MVTTGQLRSAAIASAIFVGLAGCTNTETLSAKKVTEEVAPPIIVTEQIDRIMADVAATSAAADSALAADKLNPRFAGPALENRTVTYAAKGKFDGRALPEEVGRTRLIDIIPKKHPWPRTFMSVTQASAKVTPVLRVVQQQSARDNYREVASAPLLPKAVVPAMSSPDKGVELVSADDDSQTAVSANAAFDRLSAVLEVGDQAPSRPEFADNPFYSTVLKEQDQERKAATEACPRCFTYTVDHAPRPDQVWAVRRSDGGILAVATLDVRREFKVADPGAKLPLTGELKALAGKSEAKQTLKIASIETIALSIPPKSAGKKIDIIGADRTLATVKAT